MRKKTYYTYIMTNSSKTLYIGVTNNIRERVLEHKAGKTKGFTEKYKLKKLVYYEEFDNIYDAIAREKQLKNWHRQWKIDLIEKMNPGWDDLSNNLPD
ncbi:MAG: hypothetical protein A3A24_03965 [Candidatus Buchananbacteria bacterium RIFCSPLOWO2_01_FULL_46_12]|uniref:GIY-YIG domain-containing protein n=2 Tax=Candidatus Buchananiibacteriota TaxID=1817903 RepID=A0A1G1YU21_9BACT|nr:MAG: hypothetical protein A2744_01465 [Candidatus Buchananbacteria bacterium RIFCSPHIGHO2_01_FULL_44_11]OGY55858.1 MAG: hypothetical protein A3A24_03965 [Candidatus Buchananbacteria bacterium RIFCSPLOWO2_01_FULL_46_12]